MSDRELNVHEAIGRIHSSSATERKEGLADLEHILNHNKNSPILDSIKDKTWHSIYEAIFQCAALERVPSAKRSLSQKSITAAAQGRLKACAKILRFAVTVGLRTLRVKTVKALLEHIIQSLPIPGGGYCEGLSLDYVKCLRIVTEYQPHVEHLRDYWSEIVDFCLAGITTLEDDSQDDEHIPSGSNGNSLRVSYRSLNLSGSRGSRAGTPKPTTRQGSAKYRNEVDDLLGCIRNLTRATNVPIEDKQDQILEALIYYLKRSDVIRPAHAEAFAAINAVLARVAVCSIDLTRKTMLELYPVIKALWGNKYPRTKDEMLMTLVLTKAHVSALLHCERPLQFEEDLENLVEVLQSDYTKRLDRDQLQLEDIDITWQSHKETLHGSSFSLRRGNIAAEGNWSVVHLIGFYSHLLDDSKKSLEPLSEQNGIEGHSKKPRMSFLYQDHLRRASVGPSSSQVCALQALAFLSQFGRLSEDQIEDFIDRLSQIITNTHGRVSSWALLTLTCVAFQKSSVGEMLQGPWISLFQLAARLVGTSSASRAACHLMDVLLRFKLVLHTSVASTVDNMVASMELHGPAIFSDSSSSLWITLLQSKAAENPSAALAIADRILKWTFSRWTPNKLDDKAYAAQASGNYRPQDLIKLFDVCSDRPLLGHSSPQFLCNGSIAQTWQRATYFQKLTSYLLLKKDKIDHLQRLPDEDRSNQSGAKSGRSSFVADQLIVDSCISETERASTVWFEWTTERSAGILPDMLRLVVTLCIVNGVVVTREDERNKRKVDILRKLNDKLMRSITEYVGTPECDHDRVDTILDLIVDHLPGLGHVSASQDVDGSIISFALHLSKSLEARRGWKQTKSDLDEDDEGMDFHDGFDSQISDSKGRDDRDSTPRDVIAVTSDIFSFRSCVSAYTYLLSCIFLNAMESMDQIGQLPSSFIRRMISLSQPEFCACHPLLSNIFSSEIPIITSDVDALVEHIGVEFLEEYEYERHEVPQIIEIDLLQGYASLWTDPATKELNQVASDTCSWFVTVGLQNNLCSPNVQLKISDLLFTLLEVRGSVYKPDPSMPSLRTCLLNLLNTGPLVVKYQISEHIPQFFERFTLGEHEKILGDVSDSLKLDLDWLEGNALRLLVIARLGSAWHTLLRLSVYYIFETGGVANDSLGHATVCMEMISESLGLNEPRELFKLFAAQLIYTYTGVATSPLVSIPYQVFDYPTLADLLQDVQEEIVAQVVMHGKDSEFAELSSMLGTSTADLVKQNFAKTFAYGFGRDFETKSALSVETRMKSLLEHKEWVELLQQHYAQIVGIFLYHCDNGTAVDKGLAARAGMEPARNLLRDMRAISSSSIKLPTSQQPVFKGSTLMDKIDKFNKRAGVPISKCWTPENYVFVLRMLLSKLHDALGPLYALSIIRKIRILVALAGDIVYSGYPLEMTLHALQTYLTEKQCADDTLGIFQFLMGHGAPYLVSRASFVSGLVLTTLISLRKFVGSSQESTTQESQHRATMNKAYTFHKWLVDKWSTYYERTYIQVHGAEESSIKAYSALISSASDALQEANAMMGSPESDVLRLMLEDRRSGRNLLQGPVRDLAFDLLCSEFASPPSYRNDILGHDRQAAGLASEVWASCKHATQVNHKYLLWAARILGRAHNATGWTTRLLRGQTGSNSFGRPIDAENVSSKQLILQTLSSLLFAKDRQAVGIVEETLRSIIVQTSNQEELNETQQLLPNEVYDGLLLYTSDVSIRLDVSSMELAKCVEIDKPEDVKLFPEWIRDLTIALSSSSPEDPVIGSLVRVLYGVKDVAETLFAPILHLVLLREISGKQHVHQTVSKACRKFFKSVQKPTTPHVRALVNAVLYLRKQTLPTESTKADRNNWLHLDWTVATQAAETCGMHTTALLFAEISTSHNAKPSKRSSAHPAPAALPEELLLSIYRNIDESDSFYGVQQNPSLSAVLDRLDYEADGFKGLLFRGARLDSQMRRLHQTSAEDAAGLVRSLANLNLNSVTHSLLSNQGHFNSGLNMVDNVLHTARKLEQWDIRAPETADAEFSVPFKVFQGISTAADVGSVRRRLDIGFLETVQGMLSPTCTGHLVKSSLRTLGILAEIDDVTTAISPETLEDAWQNMVSRQERMVSAQVEDIRPILSSRETLFSTLSSNVPLLIKMKLAVKDVRSIEVKALISSCTVSRQRNSLQESLATATYLSDLIPVCSEFGFDIEAVAHNEVADVLWDQGEHSTSIRMLRNLAAHSYPKSEQHETAKSKILAKLGHHVAEARLEQPEEIMNNYLLPAIKELRGQNTGSVPGQVFHQFASFCDAQLQNPDAIEDFNRVEGMRNRRSQEMKMYQDTIRTSKSSTEKARCKSEFRKVEKWFKLDDHEYQRLRTARQAFMTQSLENYLLALAASDDNDNDVLRFFAIWLEYAESQYANDSVNHHLSKVPSWKFARLMNQLSSRLQDEDTLFQSLLSNLVLRISTDHPYHAMFHISAGIMSLGVKDAAGKSRVGATRKIAATLEASRDEFIQVTWKAIDRSNHLYHNLAILKDKEGEQRPMFKQGQEIALAKLSASNKLATTIAGYKVPPPTMTIPLRTDKNYRAVPKIRSFKKTMRIANGLSAPKILTALCTDGQQFKQLFKGGNDDLRQDAIMEQVFEEVSKILRNHTATRQRNLLIRTYKVLPLSAQSGIMEFVQNTMALQDVLIPLHEKYNPKDLSTGACRSKVFTAVSHPTEQRIKIFKEVISKFSPVMRYFFFENFVDPDEWFEKRLAYTRSTAAISMLGHIVGLGDRHLHNILLDQYSGEVVHIDLGVAFEAGRILPVAEVVPFRLSRDLVDGMGYTKTEGVFRRCCEFTMDALREERESIMTLLNVLRYDPLYSWTVSPLKAKRLQETEDDKTAVNLDDGTEGSKRTEDDVGEAARALTVVEKKLSKTLSTAATVSELIAQATDERNLAVLFAGWSAWV
ncbi:ataxia telangiectasia mutated [Tothia fuscella]|uniref:Serine/threonine-protein kinase Tel1 n=1 Tax=Tothia fuscella TaxID=1048955 RepID=A0A9P4TUR5_9PEZI|nr:ataxia telangiectasia mutated [Tothia fuscella]